MKKDDYGNWPKWWAPAYLRRDGAAFTAATTDVFFVHAGITSRRE